MATSQQSSNVATRPPGTWYDVPGVNPPGYGVPVMTPPGYGAPVMTPPGYGVPATNLFGPGYGVPGGTSWDAGYGAPDNQRSQYSIASVSSHQYLLCVHYCVDALLDG